MSKVAVSVVLMVGLPEGIVNGWHISCGDLKRLKWHHKRLWNPGAVSEINSNNKENDRKHANVQNQEDKEMEELFKSSQVHFYKISKLSIDSQVKEKLDIHEDKKQDVLNH